MDGQGGSIFDNPLIDELLIDERLEMLREQRMLLRQLRDDVELAVRTVASGHLGEYWRSAAQRCYAVRLGELTDDLRGAWRQLDEALTAVHGSIARLTASE